MDVSTALLILTDWMRILRDKDVFILFTKFWISSSRLLAKIGSAF